MFILHVTKVMFKLRKLENFMILLLKKNLPINCFNEYTLVVGFFKPKYLVKFKLVCESAP